MEMPVRHPRPRLTAQDWVDAASAVMAENGLEAVAVEPVARRLGATKGSFYWHFTDRAALLRAVVDRWSGRTAEIIERLSAVSDPRHRVEALFASVYEGTDTWWARIEIQLLSRAADPAVADALVAATDRRIEFIASCLRESGTSDEAAHDGALQAYAMWIGLLQLAVALPGVAPKGDDALRFRTATLRLLGHLTDADALGS